MNTLPSCTDYITSIETPPLIKAAVLQGGHVVLKNSKTLRYAGGFCVVFPYILSSGKKVAVRCWIAYVPDAEKRCSHIAKQLSESGLPYFVDFEYIPNGLLTPLGIYPIAIMDWVDALPLKEYIKSHINDSCSLKKLADNFKTMMMNLHKAGFSHGDLQHGNIMVNQTGQLYLVDYDSMFVPGLEGVTDEIKGLAGYQHPGRGNLLELSPKVDYFSELIIYTSLLALSKIPALWSELDIENTETLLFSQQDIDNFRNSNIRNKLKNDQELSVCADAIERELSEPDICDLLPLEEAIIPPSEKMIGNLRSIWSNHTMPQKEEPTADIASLTNKWNQAKHPQETTIEVDTDSISNKWK